MKKITGCAVALALAIFASGCGGGSDGGGGGGASDDVCGGATLGCLTGVVQDDTGVGINGVQVTYEAATALTTTNAQGWFSATGLPQGSNVVCFEATGKVKKCSNVMITAKENTPLPPVKLPTRATAIKIANVEGGGTADDATSGANTGARVTFPASSVCDSAGAAVTGDIDCYLTPQDVTGAEITDLVPESFVAVTAAGARGTMVSSAIMELTCEQGGAEVNLCSGKQATVRIPVYGNDAACKDVATNPASLDSWRYDETAGLWSEYETADFAVNCGGTAPGTAGANQYYQGNIDHMTWINGDKWVADACLTGVVYASADQATDANVTVSCWGAGWRNQIQVEANGRFCMPVPNGRAYTCRVGDSSRWIEAAGYLSGTAPTTTVSFPVDSCPATDCQDIGSFVFASPILTTTLTWGLAPTDLDSHTINNDNSVHVWYSDKDIDVTKGSLTSAPYIMLDTDDVTSFGPEVTTVMPSVADGKYCFGIHNFSGESNMADASTDQNGNPKKATVTVIGEGVAQTYTVPDNPNNYLWWLVYSVEFEGGMVKSGSFTAFNDMVETPPESCAW